MGRGSKKVSYTEELGFEMGLKISKYLLETYDMPGIGDRERANWLAQTAENEIPQ